MRCWLAASKMSLCNAMIDTKNTTHQRRVRRQAARGALLELGLLTITRRSIPLPLKRKK